MKSELPYYWAETDLPFELLVPVLNAYRDPNRLYHNDRHLYDQQPSAELRARNNMMWELRKLNGARDGAEPEGFYDQSPGTA